MSVVMKTDCIVSAKKLSMLHLVGPDPSIMKKKSDQVIEDQLNLNITEQ